MAACIAGGLAMTVAPTPWFVCGLIQLSKNWEKDGWIELKADGCYY
jgi:hypothetical protein